MSEARAALAALLGAAAPLSPLELREGDEPLAELKLEGFSFLLCWRSQTNLLALSGAFEMLGASEVLGASAERPLPLIVVPFMGPSGRERCAEAGIGWFDLSGNADFKAPGLRVLVRGEENRFKRRGRPTNLFASKRARVLRWLLLNPDQRPTQRALASELALDEGYLSKIVSAFIGEGILTRDEERRLMLCAPELLLEAWRDRYDPAQHELLYEGRLGKTASPTQTLGALLERHRIHYVFTGSAGASLFGASAPPSQVELFLESPPPPELLTELRALAPVAHAEASDAHLECSLRLLSPKDESVFWGSVERRGLSVAHPIQLLLDLKEGPQDAVLKELIPYSPRVPLRS